MQFSVWHRVDPTFFNNNVEELSSTFPAGFVHVADVETPHIGRVYELTNHIDHPWNENPGVRMISARSARSTSVGDVIVAHGTGGNLTTHWTIDMLGMREFHPDGRVS